MPELIEQAKRRGKSAAFCEAVAEIKLLPIKDVLRRLATVEDALMFWVLHLVLDAAEVPPCLREPYRDERPQLRYLTWLADMLWIAKRYREHKPVFSRWSGLFRHEPGRLQWHKTAIWIYKSSNKQSYYHSRGLGLSDEQRQPLMTLLSNAMRGDRLLLRRLPELRDQIWLHACQHPDRSGVRSASEIADRRAMLLRLYLLAGRSKSRAADYYERLTNEPISRQALTRQLEAVELATGMRSLSSRSLGRLSPPLVGYASRTP